MFSHLNQIFTCYKCILYLTYHERVWSSVFLGSYFLNEDFQFRSQLNLKRWFPHLQIPQTSKEFGSTAQPRKDAQIFVWLGLFGNMILVSIRVFPPTNMQSTVDLVISLDCLVSYVFSWYKSLIPFTTTCTGVIPGKPKRSRVSISFEVGEALRPELLAALKSHLTRHSGFGTPRRIAPKYPAKWDGKLPSKIKQWTTAWSKYRRYDNF